MPCPQEVGAKKDHLDFAQFHKLYNLLMFEQKDVSAAHSSAISISWNSIG